MTSADTGIVTAIPQNELVGKLRHRLTAYRDGLPNYEIVWWLLVACLALGNLRVLLGENTGVLFYITAFGGAAGCAWVWLFSRTLFRQQAALTPWPVTLLFATVMIEGVWEVTNGLPATGLGEEPRRLIANAASYICISLLVLVFVEAFHGYGKNLPRAERRLRQIFTGVLGAALIVAVLWVWGAPEGSVAEKSQSFVQAAFGLVTVVGGRFAIEFRKQHPLSGQTAPRREPRERPTDDVTIALAPRIQQTLQRENFYATPKLKVSDLANALGEPEYKVTHCITGVMGHQNFNRLVNTLRVAHAKAALRNKENDDRQILSIALECGFNSVGPFNRAFKEEVGMTPRRYRAEHN